jgi:L-threonylcarbamoyladenylate synthase
VLPSIPITKAGRIILAGGVVAYPTEGVYGLGCLPHDEDAVARILSIKRRSPAQGLILIAADINQLTDWINLPADSGHLESSMEKPLTWVVQAAADVPYWIQGEHSTLAVRITCHPVAAALCSVVDGPLVSTSANLSGHAPARNIHVLRRTLGHLVDYIVPGACGSSGAHSEIRELASGNVLRTAS